MTTEARQMLLAAQDAERAASRLENAAEMARAQADRLEAVLYQIQSLTGSGYGNNVERFIEAAAALQFTEPKTHTST